MDFHFLGVSYDEKERRYVGPILVMRLQSAQVPTAGQISFTIQETGKVAILCRSGSNLFTGKSHRRCDHSEPEKIKAGCLLPLVEINCTFFFAYFSFLALIAAK